MPLFEIFPTVVKVEKLDILPEEIDVLLKMASEKDNLILNTNGNSYHKETYIFDTLLKDSKLSKDVASMIDAYTKDVFGEAAKISYTQSWLNVNPPGSGHHKHFHPNSILSGVVYVSTEDDSGDFFVYREEDKRTIKSDIVFPSKYAGASDHFKPKEQEIFIFPSTLFHSVGINRSFKNRISLSFNSFYIEDIARFQLADLKFSKFKR